MTKTEASKERLKEEQAGAALRRALLQYSLREEAAVNPTGLGHGPCPWDPAPARGGLGITASLCGPKRNAIFLLIF